MVFSKVVLVLKRQLSTSTTFDLDLLYLETLDGDEGSLKVHISNIRRKLKTVTNEDYIEAVWGIGYKLI